MMLHYTTSNMQRSMQPMMLHYTTSNMQRSMQPRRELIDDSAMMP
jgi:hypothetical protein